ncbi:FAD binding domain-containing protein [Rhodoplanes sp. TEM]|uniref:FAD binding domain-containing protein n=1 Tax=Rhodoplanes tepidamans TaxID=200616 RepID=A0ABT5J7K3_RHOTP|nr:MULTISPECIES: FAD binding domain-containing protein [Rhodoplanes]MDC7785493.1 FAD binding domain-containing protein [Rhodoplanes tepidamans]MDC7986162.1 FAD binding domain-containing protein [Rhodoplanes sp. TEM]MDQ0353337.1 carbon-monoxide dehydrogenase medium subunit [Rhodoplanes tepidamans]
MKGPSLDLHMDSAQFDYVRVLYAEEAVNVLAQCGERGVVLAGGQSLIPQMSLRSSVPHVLVDLGQATDLRTIEARGDTVAIGAMVTHAMIEDGLVPDPMAGILPYVAHGIAHRDIRNRGTLGGTACWADPCADWPTALMALDATMVTLSQQGERRIPITAFYPEAFTNALGPAEIVTSIVLPRSSKRARWGYYKVTRTVSESADAIAAVISDPERGVSRVVLGGLKCPPLVLDELSTRLRERPLEPGEIRLEACKEMISHLPALVDVNLHNYAFALSRALRSAFVA